jgi:hypothetical protein
MDVLSDRSEVVRNKDFTKAGTARTAPIDTDVCAVDIRKSDRAI